MKKIDRYLMGETVRDCTDRFKAYLPPDLRPHLDDLVEMVSDLEAVNETTMTDKGLRCYEKAFARLATYYKNNPVVELTERGEGENLSPLSKYLREPGGSCGKSR